MSIPHFVLWTVSIAIYGIVFIAFCVAAFFEEDSNQSEELVVWGFFWPAGLVFMLVVGPFVLLGIWFEKWRAGILQRRREARLAHVVAVPPTPEPAQLPSPIDYRHGECSQCGHIVQERKAG
jgi:hypothetical protein